MAESENYFSFTVDYRYYKDSVHKLHVANGLGSLIL